MQRGLLVEFSCNSPTLYLIAHWRALLVVRSFVLEWWVVATTTTISSHSGGSSCGLAYFMFLTHQHKSLVFWFSLMLQNQASRELWLWGPQKIRELHLVSHLSLRSLFPSYMTYMPHYISTMPVFLLMTMVAWRFMNSFGVLYAAWLILLAQWMTSDSLIPNLKWRIQCRWVG